jgi:peptide/nickel transport system permease protein
MVTNPPIVTPALVGLRRTRDVPWASRRRWLGANAVPLFCGVLILLFAVAAIVPGWLAPYDPLAQVAGARLKSPGGGFLFGTDELGRDILSRVIWGARVSLAVGLFSVAAGTLVGVAIGLVSGYFGGVTDLIIQRVLDSFMAIPVLVLAMAITALLGQGLVNAMIAVAIVLIPNASRVVRSSVLSTKQELYIEAARTLGCRHGRILTRHLLPNVLAPIIVVATSALGNAILVEASLSFLGLGVQPPAPSWGQMLSGGGREYMERAPWLAIFPGAAITLVVLSYNLLGDAIRDWLDPRLRKG